MSELSPFLIISGMHRSGTSFLARALNLSGVYLGTPAQLTHTDINPHPTNAFGHWEHQRLQSLADQTLALTDGSWDQPPLSITVTPEIAAAVAEEIARLRAPAAFASGFKDPRTLLVWEAWRPYLPEESVVIGIFRHPEGVERSLAKRDGFEREKAVALWLAHNRKLLSLVEQANGFLLDFDWPADRLSDELSWICRQLHLPYTGIARWYKPALIKAYRDDALSQDVAALHADLKARSQRNREVQLKLPPPSAGRLSDISHQLLLQMEEQALFFRNVHDQDKAQELIQQQQAYINYLEDKNNIEALHQHIANLQESLTAIRNSRTWKLLRSIDRLLGRSQPEPR
ncbi:MAG: hypothetical protein R3301_01025 [Saprospiraceae bacterium]|nr:hypothetical protein [Saprospiraceae bacterium]